MKIKEPILAEEGYNSEKKFTRDVYVLHALTKIDQYKAECEFFNNKYSIDLRTFEKQLHKKTVNLFVAPLKGFSKNLPAVLTRGRSRNLIKLRNLQLILDLRYCSNSEATPCWRLALAFSTGDPIRVKWTHLQHTWKVYYKYSQTACE